MNKTEGCQILDDFGKLMITISNKILLICPSIMIVFGTLANMLIIAILTRKKLRQLSTFYYLKCLAVIDSMVLYTFCLNFILFYNFKIDLQSQSIILCKIYSFCIYFLPQYSAWICAAVNIDRVICVLFTMHGRYAMIAKRWNTPTRARNNLLVIGVCLFLLNLQFLFYPNEYKSTGPQPVEDINLIYCSAENIPHLQNYYQTIWVHVDLSISVLIPFGIMILSSIIIIARVKKSTRNVINHQRKSTLHSITESTQNFGTSSTRSTRSTRSTSVFIKQKKNSASCGRTRNLSTMLVLNNFLFISLSLPIVGFLSFTPSITDESICVNVRAILRLFKIICILLMNANCIINVFVYSFMAGQFRREVVMFFFKIIKFIKFRR